MNQTVKELWVSALRSGEYTKGEGALKQIDNLELAYCCLGVLCELAVNNGVEIDVSIRSIRELQTYFYDDNGETLPPSVRTWAGLATADPKVEIDGVLYSLVSINDGDQIVPSTFNEIADYVEASL
jgi:hypothetical protein